jgi:type IV secretion system protein VirD4
VSILYTQIFQMLFALADTKYDGCLPQHVHFICDEFSNVNHFSGGLNAHEQHW